MTVNHNGINATRDGKAVWEPDAEPATPQTARDAVIAYAATTRTVTADGLGPLLDAYRDAVLNRAADEVFALDYDVMVGEEGDENLGSMREAWDLGTVHATLLLRRLADEAQQPEPEAEPTAEETARANVLALHQIGEQLAGIESWMWEHLADVRDAAKARPVSGPCVAGEQQNETPEAEAPTCPDREPLIGVQCSKESGHEGPHSDRPGRIWYPVPAAEALDPRPEPDEPASTCTCGDAGDAFVPLGHYRDCPDAAGAQPG